MQSRHRRGHDGIAQPRFADQHVVGRAAPVATVDAKTSGGVALRIEVDDQHALADRRECGTQIDGGGGLAYTALLVRQRQDARVARGSWCVRLLLNIIDYGHARVPLDLADGLRRSI